MNNHYGYGELIMAELSDRNSKNRKFYSTCWQAGCAFDVQVNCNDQKLKFEIRPSRAFSGYSAGVEAYNRETGDFPLDENAVLAALRD